MGCGAFMLATQHKESDEFRELYDEFEFVECHFVKDMIEQTKLYINDDLLRTSMANRAYLKREQHLWTNRLKQFLASKLWQK